MALSDQLSKLAARAKEAEDRAAAAMTKAKAQLEQDVKTARESAQAKWNLLKEKGMEVTELTPAQSRAFQDQVQPVYAEYEPVIGKELMDALRAIDR